MRGTVPGAVRSVVCARDRAAKSCNRTLVGRFNGVTRGSTAPAAWRYSPQSGAPRSAPRRCCLMRLIKPAIHDAGILKMVVLRHYGAYLPGRRHRWRLHCGRFPRPVLRHRFCWHRLRPSLAMRDELGIAGRTRPWRHTIRQLSPSPSTNAALTSRVCVISAAGFLASRKFHYHPISGWTAFVAGLWSQHRTCVASFALSPLIVGRAACRAERRWRRGAL
jgi:hypothetical protein